MSENNNKSGNSLLESLPKIITAVAGLITAIALILNIEPITNALFPPTATPAPAVSTPLEPPEDDVDVGVSTPLPLAQDFQACETPCNGKNSSEVFSEKAKRIYAQFNYENFQKGDQYVRIWSLNGKEWIRYSCDWDGPVSGTEVLTFKESKGLDSGIWEITVFVNDEVVLKDEISINGNWEYWDPAGTFYTCHSTN